MMRRFSGLAGFLATALVYPSHARAAQCELHVFPTDDVKVVTNFANYGLFGALIGGDYQPRDIFLRDLPPQAQTQAISEIANLPSLLKFPDVDIVRETRSIDYKSAKKTKERMTASTVDCYAELVITYLMYTDNVVNGRRIGTLAIFRRFDGGNAQPSIKLLGGSGKLALYPTKDADRREAAIVDLTDGFKAAIVQAAVKFIR